MTDQVDGKGSSRPNSASDGPAELPYSSIGPDLPGHIEIKEDRRGGFAVRIPQPIGVRLLPPPFYWLGRFLTSFLGGVAGAVVFLWLRAQPAFQRLVEGLPTWP